VAAPQTAPRFPSGWRSLTEHASDPQKLYRAARALGIMLGDGRIGDDDAYGCVRLWVSDAAPPDTTTPDPSGLQARLCHAVSASAAARRNSVEHARRAAATVGGELILRSAPPAHIIRQAKAAAEKACIGALGEDEIRSILRDEWERLRARSRRR
jgi:hypothetical protein